MIGVLMDAIYREHDTGGHPECGARLLAVERAVGRLPREDVSHLHPVSASVEDLELVHEANHIRQIRSRIEAGATQLDMDTVVSPRSFDVALHAVGGALAGLDRIIAGEMKRAFFAVRPPGHHAEPGRAMGFCLFNNIAIGARHLQKRHGVDRVAIYDFDVHHGNGTMEAFIEDPTVFYASVHQWPLYPGTGHPADQGRGAGRGTTLNMPYPAGAGNREYQEATQIFCDAMDRFRPQVLLISAGFDAHFADPLAGHEVDEEGYTSMATLLRQLADAHCDGRVGVFLEGGYHLKALENSVFHTLTALSKDP
jgi:acetoin utilization deacetylase AcuC-like enzyme